MSQSLDGTGATPAGSFPTGPLAPNKTNTGPKLQTKESTVPIMATTQMVPGAYAGAGVQAKVELGSGFGSTAALGKHIQDDLRKREVDAKLRAQDSKSKTGGKKLAISTSYVPPLLPEDQLEEEPQVRFYRSKKKEDKVAIFYCSWSKDWTTAFEKPKDLFKTKEVEFRNINNWLRNMQYATANMSKVSKVVVRGCIVHNDALSDMFRLPSMEELELHDCISLTVFPTADLPAYQLRTLRITGCDKLVWPPSAGEALLGLMTLEFPVLPWTLSLDLTGLPSLQTLVLGGTRGRKTHSERIEIGNSRTLRKVVVTAGTSIRTLVLQMTTELEVMQFGEQVCLERLQLLNCPSVDVLDLRTLQQGHIPQQQLQRLRLVNCASLVRVWLPNRLLPLDVLDVENCPRLTDLRLNTFVQERTDIPQAHKHQRAPVGQVLRVHKCGQLREIGITAWPRLTTLQLTNCSVVEAPLVAQLVASLPLLRELSLTGCMRLAELPAIVWTKPHLSTVDVRECKYLAELNLPEQSVAAASPQLSAGAAAAAGALSLPTPPAMVKVFVDADMFDYMDEQGEFEEPVDEPEDLLPPQEDSPLGGGNSAGDFSQQPAVVVEQAKMSPPIKPRTAPPPPPPPPPLLPKKRETPPPLAADRQQGGLFKSLGRSLKRAFSRKGSEKGDKGQSVDEAVAEAEAVLREMFPHPEPELPKAEDYYAEQLSANGGTQPVVASNNRKADQSTEGGAQDQQDGEDGIPSDVLAEAGQAAKELRIAVSKQEDMRQLATSMPVDLRSDARCEEGMVTKCPPEQNTYDWEFRNSGTGETEFQIEFGEVTVHRIGQRGRYTVMASPYNTLVNVSAAIKLCRHAHRAVRIKVVSLQAYSIETPVRSSPGQPLPLPENLVPMSLQFAGMPLPSDRQQHEELPLSLPPSVLAVTGGTKAKEPQMQLPKPLCSLTTSAGATAAGLGDVDALLPGEVTAQQAPGAGSSSSLSLDNDENPMQKVTRVVPMPGKAAGDSTGGAFAVQRLPRSKLLIPKAGFRARREFSETWIDQVEKKAEADAQRKAAEAEAAAKAAEEEGAQTAGDGNGNGATAPQQEGCGSANISPRPPTAPGEETAGDGGSKEGSGEPSRRAKRMAKRMASGDRLGAAGDFEVLSLYDLPDDRIPVIFQWGWPEVVPDEIQVRVALDLTLGRVVDRRKRKLDSAEEVSVTLQAARRVRLPPMELSFKFPTASPMPSLPTSPRIDEVEVLTRMGVDPRVQKNAGQVVADAEAEARKQGQDNDAGADDGAGTAGDGEGAKEEGEGEGGTAIAAEGGKPKPKPPNKTLVPHSRTTSRERHVFGTIHSRLASRDRLTGTGHSRSASKSATGGGGGGGSDSPAHARTPSKGTLRPGMQHFAAAGATHSRSSSNIKTPEEVEEWPARRRAPSTGKPPSRGPSRTASRDLGAEPRPPVAIGRHSRAASRSDPQLGRKKSDDAVAE